ncbi:MAG: GNAT family N-acetyltransferase, partial [Candidatus Hydrogenedentes bacterium]|nr:GNAT family N-acetyltransferase [Candidatus Hydrogenedentota bacterium]
GTQLILELAHCFREAGLERIALGVTNDNPARRLYERLGFRKILPVNAYVWWK